MSNEQILALGGTGKTGRSVDSQLRERGHLPRVASRAWARADDPDLLAAAVSVQAFGGEWTILRPTWFAQNFGEEPFLRDLIRDGRVTLPAGEGLVPFVDVEDIAAVAATVLTEDGHAGRMQELTGARLLTFGAAIEEYARASGRDLLHVPVSSAQFVARLIELGHPAEAAAFLSLMLGWVRAGHEADLSDDVEQVLGRASTDFRDYLRRTATAG